MVLAQGLAPTNVFQHIREMGLIGQGVLLMLILFSLGSWAIIIYLSLIHI